LQRLLERRDAGTPDPRKIRVGPYLRAWIETVNGLAPATLRQHEQIIRNHLEPAFGRMMLSDLTRNHVNAYLAASPLHPQTLRHHRATLRLVLAGAVGDRLITANAASLASAPKLPDVERRWLTSAQCKALIEGTRDTRLWAFWVLAITTGLREAEMLGLTWEDVDLGDARAHLDGRSALELGAAAGGAGVRAVPGLPSSGTTVHVRHTLHRIDGAWQLHPPKTRKSRRDVPLPPLAVEALRGHRIAQLTERAEAGRLGPDGLVFTTVTGLPYWGSNLLPELREHLARLGLPRVSIHALRHSAGSILYEQGIRIEVIADWLGHSSVRMAQELYVHRGRDTREQAAEAMARALG
jgi:integrase